MLLGNAQEPGRTSSLPAVPEAATPTPKELKDPVEELEAPILTPLIALTVEPKACAVLPNVIELLVSCEFAIEPSVPPSVREPEEVTVPVRVIPFTVPVPLTDVTVPVFVLVLDKVPPVKDSPVPIVTLEKPPDPLP